MAHVRLSGENVDVTANLSTFSRPLCANGTPWIFYLFEECVENIWEYLSVVIGVVSMFCFLLSTLPQVYEAYRTGKVDEAMSLGFILFLLCGDLSNFAGCYLTKQLPIQMVTAVFYIYTDSVLISQFLYYKIRNSSSSKKPYLMWTCIGWFVFGTALCVVLPKIIADINISASLQGPSRSEWRVMSGYVCGYLASLCYLSSRFPQLYKNYKRQSTQGTSYLLFALAMLGNGTYGVSLMVILPALPSGRATFIINHLAWLLGSLGVLFLDFFVTAQFIMYRKNKPSTAQHRLKFPEAEPLLCEEDEL